MGSLHTIDYPTYNDILFFTFHYFYLVSILVEVKKKSVSEIRGKGGKSKG